MEWKYAVVTGTKTVHAAPCLVKSVYINESPSLDSTLSDSTTRVHLIPSGAAQGNCYDFGDAEGGVRYETSLIVSAGGGDVTVHYYPLGEERSSWG